MPSHTTETYAPNALIVGDYPVVTRSDVIASGQELVRGAVLGKITASGKYVQSLSAAADGSQVPIAVLVDDTDATGGDKKAGIYESGQFDEDKLTLGAGHTVASVRDDLRAVGIHLAKAKP